VGRKPSFVLVRKLNSKNAAYLVRETMCMFVPYEDLIHSITCDNGTELDKHEYIAKK